MENLTFEQLPTAVGLLFESLKKIERLLETRTETQEAADQIFDIQEAADFIKKTVPTIYGLVHRSEIPNSKQGKKLYFSKQELTDWIKSGRRKTTTETAAEAEQYIKNKKNRL